MSRAASAVVGVVLLVGVTVAGGAAVLALAPDAPDRPPQARLSLSVDAAADRVALTHEGGEPIAVDRATVHIAIEGSEIAHQPPVPFFASEGFISGPTGPFNSGSDARWTAGETGAVRLAATNTELRSGDRVTVVVRTDGGVVARLSAGAR